MVDKEINALATALLERIDELTKEMAARIRAGSRAYHYDVVPEEDLEDACRTHVGNALQALTGQVPLDTGAAAGIGRRRAAQNVPLPSVMTAYRVGVRYFWETVVAEATTTSLVGNDILVAAASAMWEIQDGITEAMVSGITRRSPSGSSRATRSARRWWRPCWRAGAWTPTPCGPPPRSWTCRTRARSPWSRRRYRGSAGGRCRTSRPS
ncbi:hypothetical protein [Streptomyces sp. 3213.3]|uniref:hypothetical protein n=1 Tax=Streptomyces sp. 3213.3 TaxID=1855348 RepID=UPI000AE74ED5|nr:hypothetical protein [Streptomyces sp. 3213.3]